MKKDWRANIKEHDSLWDLDPREIMVFLRHNYLTAAKDLTKEGRPKNDIWFGLECAQVAEKLQEALEVGFGEKINLMLEPA